MTLAHRSAIATIFTFFSAVSLTFAQRPDAASPSPPVPDIVTEPQGLVAEPDVVRRAAIYADRHFSGGQRGIGFYVNFKEMIPGSGWLGVGPGYRQWLAKDQILIDGWGAISVRNYKILQGQFELPKLIHSRLALGTQVKWQDSTQVSYFGDGPLAPVTNRSEYRLQSTDLVGYATVRPLRRVAVDGELGWLSPNVMPRAGGVKPEVQETERLFASHPVYQFDDQPSFLRTGASITADTRDFPDRPLSGVLVSAGVSHYSDRHSGLFSFKRYETEGAGFVPLAGSRVVLALHGWVVASATDEGQVVPFYLEPSLGGNNSLRGYDNYRFHDRNLLLLNIETRAALMTHLDAAVMFDAGNVAARVGDLDLGRRSFGGGVRVHTRRVTFARFDVARSDEGWRAMFSFSDPLALARITKRTATVPFVP